VIVAVTVVRVMEVSADEVIDVVAVRYALVPAIRAVRVRRLVRAAGVRRRAAREVLTALGDQVLVDVVAVDVMQVSVVQVIDVPLVLDGRMAAARAVLVRVAFVGPVIVHGPSSPRRRASPAAGARVARSEEAWGRRAAMGSGHDRPRSPARS
jgi:hypothetical protein